MEKRFASFTVFKGLLPKRERQNQNLWITLGKNIKSDKPLTREGKNFLF
jgi:hypothetical protein